MSKAVRALLLVLFAAAAGCNYSVTPSGTPHGESTAGAEATGGEVSGSGGDAGSGGNAGSGGSPSNGGNAGSGGNPGNSGGTTSLGGSSAGGNQSSGGRVGSGGTNSNGGSSSAGGTPSAGGSSAAKPDAGTSSVSFSGQIQPLLNQYCTSCHGASGASAGVSLNNYTNVKTNASRANTAIQGGIMPPGSPLSAANKQLFQAWVTAGTPNN
jgi:hypothetical protein